MFLSSTKYYVSILLVLADFSEEMETFDCVKLIQINFLPTNKISSIHKMLSFYNNLGGVDCILMWTLFMSGHLNFVVKML